MLRAAVVSCVLLGCAYKPGSFEYGAGFGARFAGERTTVGCLDVAVDRRDDYEASAILAYRFGNRCNHPIDIDLVYTKVVGRFADGTEVALAPYDPRLELRIVRLDGRLGGGEALAYPTPRRVAQVCVDVASLIRQQPSSWMCFGSRAEPEPAAPLHDDLDAPSAPQVTAEVTP